VAAWSILDGVLTLAGADAAPLVVLEPGVDEDTGVRGLWRITGLAARDGTTVDPTLLATAEATFGGGQFRATVGCNWITGSYLDDGPRLTITPEFRTLIGCHDLNDAEEALNDALHEVAAWAVDGDTLVLVDQAGNGRIWLVSRGAVDPVPSSGVPG
jgi:heat shock protein HslJ